VRISISIYMEDTPMNNKPTKLMSTILAMLLVFMFAVVGMAPLAGADGSSADVTKTDDFDSSTGCTDVTSPLKAGETESIKITGGTGIIELDDFREGEISFYAYFDTNADKLGVKIVDEDDADNYIEIVFDPNGDEMYVDVKDHTDSGSQTVDEDVDLGSSNEALDAWLLIEITITGTREYDGTGSQLNIDVENKDAIEDFPLLSYELEGKFHVRKFNDAEFTVVSDQIVYVENIDMDVSSISTLGNYTLTVLIIAIALVLLIVFLWFGWFPFSKGPLGRSRKKIVSPLKKG